MENQQKMWMYVDLCGIHQQEYWSSLQFAVVHRRNQASLGIIEQMGDGLVNTYQIHVRMHVHGLFEPHMSVLNMEVEKS